MPKRGSYKTLMLVDMYDILQWLRKGESAVKLPLEFRIPRTTVSDIKINGNKIEEFMSKMEVSYGNVNKRKRMTTPIHIQLDKAIFIWFSQQLSQGFPLSGAILIQKVFHMSLEFGIDNFKASQFWLDKFKARQRIRQLDIEGENLSMDSEVLVDYTKKFIDKISSLNLAHDQVYNCIETGLNWKALLNKTLASSYECCASWFKVRKEQITVIVCTNASESHNLPVAIIGKSRNEFIKNSRTYACTYWMSKRAINISE